MSQSSIQRHLHKWKTGPSNGTNKAILGEENPKTTEVLLYGRMNKIHTSSIYSEGYWQFFILETKKKLDQRLF